MGSGAPGVRATDEAGRSTGNLDLSRHCSRGKRGTCVRPGRTHGEEAIPENESFPKCTPDRTYILYTCNIYWPVRTAVIYVCACARPPSDTRPAPRPPSPGRPTDDPAGTAGPGKGHLKKKKRIYISSDLRAAGSRFLYLFLFSRKSIEVRASSNGRLSRNLPPTSQSPERECGAVPVNGRFL